MTETCTFFTFTHVRQTCFAYNFGATTFSTDGFKISVKFCVILVLFSIFKAKRAKNSSKNQKTYLVHVSQISILHPSKGLYSSFSKKSQIRCTLLHTFAQALARKRSSEEKEKLNKRAQNEMQCLQGFSNRITRYFDMCKLKS